MAYGPDEIYTRISQHSLLSWKDFFARIARPELFRETGVLWLAAADDALRCQSGSILGATITDFPSSMVAVSSSPTTPTVKPSIPTPWSACPARRGSPTPSNSWPGAFLRPRLQATKQSVHKREVH